MQLAELVRTAQVVGPGNLLRLARARRLGFERYVRGHYATRVICTLLNVGFFDALASDGPTRVEDFAAARGLDADILRSLCDYLYALKVLDSKDGRYTLGSDGRLIQETLRGLFDLADAYEEIPHHLEGLLTGTRHYGKDVQRKDEAMVRGTGAGGRLFTFPLVIDTLKRNGFKHPMDLACGDAAFLIEVCKRSPGVTAYGVDISTEAIAFARTRVEAEGLSDRVHLFAEDMFEIQRVADQLGRVDVVTSFYGFQELLFRGRDKVLGLLQRYRAALPGASFVVCEIPKYSPEELRRSPRGILEYQLYHSLTHQRLATRQEWMSLWREAGFGKIDEQYLEFARTVIYTLSW